MVAPAVREQVDWSAGRRRPAGSPFGPAFVTPGEGLGTVPAEPDSGGGG